MSTLTFNPISIFGKNALGTTPTINKILSRISTTWKHHKEYRRSIAELSACSDRTLHDLGIYRSDIPRLVRKPINDQ